MRLIPKKLTLQENAVYKGLAGELITIPGTGVAVHDGFSFGGVVVEQAPEITTGGINNICRNSNFFFVQNGTSWLANPPGATYISDGWWIQHGGSSTSNVARLTGGALVDPLSTALRITTTTGGLSSSFSTLTQVYSEIRSFANRKAVLSFDITCDSATSIACELGMTFADGGTANRQTLIGRADIPKNIRTHVSLPFVMPAITTSDVIAEGDKSFLKIWLEAGDDFNERTGGIQPLNASFDIANVHLELSEVETPYTLLSVEQEEGKVMRYYEKSTLTVFAYNGAFTSHSATSFLTAKFAFPKWTQNATFQAISFTTVGLSGDSINDRDKFGFTIIATASDTPAGSAGRITDYTIDAELAP